MGVISGCDLFFLNQCRELIKCRPLSIDLQVGISLRRLNVAVPENFADCIKVNAKAKHDARARMAQVVKIHMLHACFHPGPAP